VGVMKRKLILTKSPSREGVEKLSFEHATGLRSSALWAQEISLHLPSTVTTSGGEMLTSSPVCPWTI
jgi:hypothetical protein